jgi:periplasmic divalent cation tolerance protein
VTDFIHITTTTDKRSEAESLSIKLVEMRLAACVQILGPVQSTYWWQGELETAEEWLLIIKTKGSHFEKIEKLIKNIHSYEVPELISTPIVKGSEDYLSWLKQEVEGRGT